MTPKAEQTRQHLIDVAMARFEADGFAGTTMRQIAKEAGGAVGLPYRYFGSKEGIVLAYYEQLAQELAARPIAGTTLGARFQSVMDTKFDLLAGKRRAMGSLLAAMLDPDGPVGLLAPETEGVRQATRAVLRDAVEGSQGLKPDAVEPLVRIAWLGHALLLLAWVQRPDAARRLVDRLAGGLDYLVPLLRLPMATSALRATVDALSDFEGAAEPTA